jgi:beta-glucosidase-like glycosyl hydrolase
VLRFNRQLIRLRGLFMGKEHKGKGVNIALGPMMNMGRVAQGGRNWEGFGADPYLSGEAAYETILGMQEGGVQACAKHFINKCVFSMRWVTDLLISVSFK